MSKQFFTKAQRNIIRNDFRVGSGYIIVKSDEGIVAYAPIYIERESGQVYNPVTGKPMVILLGGDDAEQSFAPDSSKAAVLSLPESVKSENTLPAEGG
ncbi:MAG: hypothetical protein JETCAE01_33450 [Anaerolineaceae bacterium]|nr:MAG: hypothetical protein JETCAE01_33450 [Anaerolineaceae bacterium]